MKKSDKQLINEALDCLVINAINMSTYADTQKEFRDMWRRKVEQINEIQKGLSIIEEITPVDLRHIQMIGRGRRLVIDNIPTGKPKYSFSANTSHPTDTETFGEIPELVNKLTFSATPIRSKYKHSIEVKLKTIDIIDTNHSISKMIAEKVEGVEGLGLKKFDLEIETEVEDLFFYATGSVFRTGHKSEPNDFTIDNVSIDLELTCNYEGYDVDFNIINDGKIEDTENYIVNLINK